jgi:hypothetical protein
MMTVTYTTAVDDEQIEYIEYCWIETESLKIGLYFPWGGMMVWLSTPGGPNVVNAPDEGRGIQQSWYGEVIAGDELSPAWNWNPVQGGSGVGVFGLVLDYSSTATTMYVKTRGALWQNSLMDNDGYMETWLTPDGDLLRMESRYTYTGAANRPSVGAEAPACWLDLSLLHIKSYTGDVPWTSGALSTFEPPAVVDSNAIFQATENWAALVNNSDWGLGLYVPNPPTGQWLAALPNGVAAYMTYNMLNIADYAMNNVYNFSAVFTIGALADIRSRFAVEYGATPPSSHHRFPQGGKHKNRQGGKHKMS